MPPKRPPLSHAKDKGEWGEIAFQAKALALGLSVSQPNGDNQPFDFIVTTRQGKLARLQIKTCFAIVNGAFHARARRSSRAYRAQEVDFFAIYIAPMDIWYIMPSNAVPTHGYPAFFPHRPDHPGPFEKYRSRWSLLTGDPEDDTRDHGLTIHAAADDGSTRRHE